MIRIDTTLFRARPESQELTSLDERLGMLFLVRVAITVLIVLLGLFVPAQVGFDVVQAGPVSAAYLLLAVAAEVYRRSDLPGRMLVHRAVLPLDSLYLVIVTTPSGGPRSPLVILFAVQLIAVTLLASERAGLRVALWDTFLFVFIPTLSLSGRLGLLMGVDQVAAPPGPATAVAIMGFWAVAICTALFSSVSERELRRSKAELSALADMAARLEGVHGSDEILSILLGTLVDAFDFRRGALWCGDGDTTYGLVQARPGSAVQAVPVPAVAHVDGVALAAWEARQPVLRRALSIERDQGAMAMLPGAANVVVLPLQIDGTDAGVVFLEHGGNRMAARLPRRVLVMLNQFTTHAGLVLRNARLLADRERLAAVDGLTGLANRREFDTVLLREVNRAERSQEPLSLVVFDVDHFKAINDSRGHLGGDEVLRGIGEVLAGAVREMDVVARYGGEEFAVVLPRCDRDDAIRVVDRITAAMLRRADLDGVTMSAGVATMPANAATARDLVEASDGALYESKRGGRNRYTVSARTSEGAGPRA